MYATFQTTLMSIGLLTTLVQWDSKDVRHDYSRIKQALDPRLYNTILAQLWSFPKELSCPSEAHMTIYGGLPTGY